ncbi:hypothetical protein OLZ32_25880 [Rhizobium sp. 1AS11]|nr:hypothetical protein [Rhizobium acaciae]MCW1411657.1 hypothetical protein [Rhizobium acaciae]MCW1743802.1 hypothetical protein [Rhizobium acaciae]MCW1752594.1 hypothetical protein [Rhizobium acaciae]
MSNGIMQIVERFQSLQACWKDHDMSLIQSQRGRMIRLGILPFSVVVH